MTKERKLAQVRCRKCDRWFTGRSLLYHHRKQCGVDFEDAKKDVREHLGEDQVGVSRTNRKRAETQPKAKPKPQPQPDPPVELLRPPEPSRPVYMQRPDSLEFLREQRRLQQAILREERSRRLSLMMRDAF